MILFVAFVSPPPELVESDTGGDLSVVKLRNSDRLKRNSGGKVVLFSFGASAQRDGIESRERKASAMIQSNTRWYKVEWLLRSSFRIILIRARLLVDNKKQWPFAGALKFVPNSVWHFLLVYGRSFGLQRTDGICIISAFVEARKHTKEGKKFLQTILLISPQSTWQIRARYEKQSLYFNHISSKLTIWNGFCSQFAFKFENISTLYHRESENVWNLHLHNVREEV